VKTEIPGFQSNTPKYNNSKGEPVVPSPGSVATGQSQAQWKGLSVVDKCLHFLAS
jgi:hypothetical protein